MSTPAVIPTRIACFLAWCAAEHFVAGQWKRAGLEADAAYSIWRMACRRLSADDDATALLRARSLIRLARWGALTVDDLPILQLLVERVSR